MEDNIFFFLSFSFQTCCTIESVLKSRGTGAPSAADRGLTLKFRLEAETFPGNNRKFSRVWFRTGNSDNQPSFIEKTIELRPARGDGKLNNCQFHTVYVKVTIVVPIQKSRWSKNQIAKLKLLWCKTVSVTFWFPGEYCKNFTLDLWSSCLFWVGK